MTEHKSDLAELARKFDERIKALEQELQEVKRKKKLLHDAFDLLTKEGVFEQRLFETTSIPLSDKYAEMDMNEAIKDAVHSSPLGHLSGDEINAELVKNGYRTSSKNLKRDVYTRLYRLEKKDELTSHKEGGVKRYSLSKQEG